MQVSLSGLESAAVLTFWEVLKDLYPNTPAYVSLAVAVRTLNSAAPGQQSHNANNQTIAQRQKAIDKYSSGLDDTEICLKELLSALTHQ